jgi:hypothetical protein
MHNIRLHFPNAPGEPAQLKGHSLVVFFNAEPWHAIGWEEISH